jgi:hypothetical protein
VRTLVGLWHLPDQRQAPGTTPAPRVLPALVILIAAQVTWLAGVNLRAAGYMSGLPPRHSLAIPPQSDEIAFQRVEHRKPLLPFSQGSSPAPEANMTLLGTLRHRLLSNLPLRAYAPFMVELFLPPDLLEYPSLVIGPAPTVASRRIPTAAHVERTQRARTPWEDSRSVRPLTCFEHDGFDVTLAGRLPKSVCIAPIPGVHRIERGDYSSGIQNQSDYFREPPSSWTSGSHRIQLYRHST